MLKVVYLAVVARQLRDNIMNENRKGVKARHKRKVASIGPSKPRNFVAKNASTTTSGAGAHKDKKKAMKQGDTKHKQQEYAEGLEQLLKTKIEENSQVHHNHVGTLRATSPVMDEEMPVGHEPTGYAERVAELEAKGLTRSDAQGVADAEVMSGAYKAWRQKGVKHTHVGTLRATSTSMEGSNPSALTKFRQGAAQRQAKHDKIEADRKKAPSGSGMKSAIDRLEKQVNTKEGWTHDSLAAQLFEQELTYEDRLTGMLNKKLKK